MKTQKPHVSSLYRRWSRVLAGVLMLSLASPMAGRVLAAEVNVYSYRQPELINPLLQRFSAETGIEVNMIFAEKGLAERIKAEGPNSPADVVLATDIARLVELVEADVVQPVVSSVLQANIPALYRDAENQWFGLTQRARVIYAARDRVQGGDVDSYEALTGAKWKGRICSRSGSNDYNTGLLAAMIAHHGEAAARQWLAGLKANLARKPQGNDRSQIKAVAQGECDIALGNTYYMGVMLADPEQRPYAEAVWIIFPNQQTSGAHVNISGVAMARHAPNRDAALKLMEFLSGEEAQRLYAGVNHEYPVSPNAPWTGLLQSWGKFKAHDLPLAEIARHRARAQELVNEVGFDQ